MKKEVVINGALCVVECTVFGFAVVSQVVGALFGVSGDVLASGAEYIRTSRQGKGEEIFLDRLKQFKDRFIPAVEALQAATSFSKRFNGRSDAPTKKDESDLASDTGSEDDVTTPSDDSDKLVVDEREAAMALKREDLLEGGLRDNCC